MNSITTTNQIDKIINILQSSGKTLENIEDILIRGSLYESTENFIENFSDIDCTIIVTEINHKVLNTIRELMAKIRLVYQDKFSATIVSESDIVHALHHHGNKPIFYSYKLKSNISLIKKKQYGCSNTIDILLQRFNTCANIAYLIHDIRNKFISLDRNINVLQNFIKHCVKRSKHLIKNVVFCLSGKRYDCLNYIQVEEFFSEVSKDFFYLIENYKKIQPHNSNDLNNLTQTTNFLLDNCEKIYKYYLKKLNINLFKI